MEEGRRRKYSSGGRMEEEMLSGGRVKEEMFKWRKGEGGNVQVEEERGKKC